MSGPDGDRAGDSPGPDRSTAHRGQVRFLAVAQIGAPHGVRGHFRARILTDFPDRFERLRTVYVGEDHRPFALRRARLLADGVLLKFEGIDSPEAARQLLHQLVYVPVEEAVELGEDEYFWYQIVGLKVYTVDGRELGEVVDILPTGANDVYVVHGPSGEVLVPAIEDVVETVDLAEGKIIVKPMEGML